MESKILIGNFRGDNRPVIEMQNVKVTYIGMPFNGVSSTTGEPYTLTDINIEFDLGEGVKRNYMRLTAPTKISQKLKDEGFRVGEFVDVQVDFNITKGNFAKTSIRIIDISKHLS